MKIKCVYSLLCILMLTFACKPQPEKLTQLVKKQKSPMDELLVSENKLREDLGLRVITEDWILYSTVGFQESWKTREGSYIAKSVFKDGARRAVEDEDYYYSGIEYYDDAEGHSRESITVHYNFKSKQIYLSYRGTNMVTKAVLSKYLLNEVGTSTEVVDAMTALRKVAINWPDGPKK